MNKRGKKYTHVILYKLQILDLIKSLTVNFIIELKYIKHRKMFLLGKKFIVYIFQNK